MSPTRFLAIRGRKSRAEVSRRSGTLAELGDPSPSGRPVHWLHPGHHRFRREAVGAMLRHRNPLENGYFVAISTSSTRRFFARPSSVLLDATGT